MWLTAEYTDEHSLARGVTSLVNAGFHSEAIEVFSPKPIDLPAGFEHRPSRASMVSILGAILAGGLASSFVYFAQHNYPLVTGGMPVYSWWATGVITFELTMAGAVGGVIAAFLWESGMFRRHRGPAPVIDHGSIYVRVRCLADGVQKASDCLSTSGAAGITKLEERR